MEPLLRCRGGGSDAPDALEDFADFSSDGASDWDGDDGEFADDSVLELLMEGPAPAPAPAPAVSNPATESTSARCEAVAAAHEDVFGLFHTAERGGSDEHEREEGFAVSGGNMEALLDELFPDPGNTNADSVPNSESMDVRGAERTGSTESEAFGTGGESKEKPMVRNLQPRGEPGAVVRPAPQTDFVSLFEEMYGDGTVLTLPPTPPPSSPVAPRHSTPPSTAKAVDKQVPSHLKTLSGPAVPESSGDTALKQQTSATFTPELLAMLQQVHDKVTLEQVTLSELTVRAARALCLPSDDCTLLLPPKNSSLDFETLASALDSLEQRLARQAFVQCFAPTREERLELIFVALDESVGVLTSTWRVKWTKTLATLPMLAQTSSQCPVQATSPPVQAMTSLSTSLPSTQAPVSKPKCVMSKSGSPLQGWAKFLPDKMPVRCQEAPKTVGSAASTPQLKPSQQKQLYGSSTKRLKPQVLVRQYRLAKLRVRCKVYNPEEHELTFHPKITKRQEQEQPDQEAFTDRMQRDIHNRRLQRKQQQEARAQLEKDEVQAVAAASLMDKGSQRILLRNGLWEESMEHRLRRLAMRHGGNGDTRLKKRQQRQQRRKMKAAARASQACESLYQRGLDQRRREEERRLEDERTIERRTAQSKMSSRSRRVMKQRIRQELALLCSDSRRASARTQHGVQQDEDVGEVEVDSVTFVEFSCALLYFGLILDMNAPWRASDEEKAEQEMPVTLLWHSWQVLACGEPQLPVRRLESVLFAIILGDKAVGRLALEPGEIQTLLGIYRANYRARKRTQQVVSTTNRTKETECDVAGARCTKPLRGRQRVHYSLHGKRLGVTGAPNSDPLSERELQTHERVAQLRLAQQQKELDECTFHPQISLSPRASQTAKRPELATSKMRSTFERLYNDAFQRQNNVLDKYLEAKLQREEQEKKHCAVRASYVNGLTIEERLGNLQTALAGNALPVDFHKKVDAMRRATEMKALDEQLKAQRLEPARFSRTRDGHTIVLPFRLATDIRAAVSAETTKRSESSSSSSSKTVRRLPEKRDRVMKAVRPPRYHKQLQPAVEAQDDRTADGDSDNDADLCLDVHLSASESHELRLHARDDPDEVVKRFARRYALDKPQQRELLQLVAAKLEELAHLER